MAFLDVGTATLYYELQDCLAGDHARTLVLLHGWCCDSTDWDDLAPDLRRLGTVLRVDLRGHGRSSDASDDDYSLVAMSADVEKLLMHVGATYVVLIGHSAGCEVAVHLGARSAFVRGVIVIDPAYGFAEDEIERVMAVDSALSKSGTNRVVAEYFSRMESGVASHSELAYRHQQAALGCRPHVAASMHHAFAFGPESFHFSPETERQLRALPVPTLAIYRNETRSRAGRLGMHDPGDRLLVYEGSGHWLHQEERERFLLDGMAWLDRLWFRDPFVGE